MYLPSQYSLTSADKILDWKATLQGVDQEQFLPVWAHFILRLMRDECHTSEAIRHISAFPAVLNELIETEGGEAKRNLLMIICEDGDAYAVHHQLFEYMINHPIFNPHCSDSNGKELLSYCRKLSPLRKGLV